MPGAQHNQEDIINLPDFFLSHPTSPIFKGQGRQSNERKTGAVKVAQKKKSAKIRNSIK